MPPRAKKRRKVYMGPDQAYVIPKQTKSNRAARAKRAAELINLSQTSGDGDNSSRCYELDDSNQSSDSNEDEITSGVTSDDQATSDGDNESDDTSEHEALFHDSCTSEDRLASGDTSGSSETGETASSGGGESEQGDPDLTTSGEDESDFKMFEELCSGPPIPGQDSTRGHVLLLILAYVVSAGLSWTQTEGLLRLVNTLFGVFVAPKSKFLFRKVWKQSQQGMVDFHFFCDRCSKPLMVCQTPLQDKKARIGAIKWVCHKNGRALESKVYAVCCIADAPARAAVLNRKQFNGYYGCPWCYHKGTLVDGTLKYPHSSSVTERTRRGVLQDVKAAVMTGTTKHGMYGPSPIARLQGFDLVWGIVPDYMHCLLEDVTKQLTELWFTSTGAPFYIGNQMAAVDRRLAMIRPPNLFARATRWVRERDLWKAKEWRKASTGMTSKLLKGFWHVSSNKCLPFMVKRLRRSVGSDVHGGAQDAHRPRCATHFDLLLQRFRILLLPDGNSIRIFLPDTKSRSSLCGFDSGKWNSVRCRIW
ncbi:uncharacterized protein ISCGN_013263 [Ixodes scapularis]